MCIEWNRCLVIDMVRSLAPDLCSDPDWSEYWDVCLDTTLRKGQCSDELDQLWKDTGNGESWSKEDYNEEEHNCFAFVLKFLKSLKQDPFSSEANNRLEFCRKFILPKTMLAGKYICLYRKIKSDHTNGVFVSNQNFESTKDNGNSDSSLEGKIISTSPMEHQVDT